VNHRGGADQHEDRRTQPDVSDHGCGPARYGLAADSHCRHHRQAERGHRIDDHQRVVRPNRDDQGQSDRRWGDPAIERIQACGGWPDQPQCDDRRGDDDRDVDPERHAIDERLAGDPEEEGQGNQAARHERIQLRIGGHPMVSVRSNVTLRRARLARCGVARSAAELDASDGPGQEG
jgi:hypothetical protein